jgi:NAD(P)-dependent dehydrogenase (short-subunit alcohol dehydrogenase family)
MAADAALAAGVDEAERLLGEGATVVIVVDTAERLTAFLDRRSADSPGRVAVVVGDPADEGALEAARRLAVELFPVKTPGPLDGTLK